MSKTCKRLGFGENVITYMVLRVLIMCDEELRNGKLLNIQKSI